MRKSQAKLLKAGDRVIWISPGGRTDGTVTRKRYNTIWIKWDGGAEQTHYADHMDKVFTQEQLDAEAEQARVVEKVKQYNAERLKTHNVDGSRLS